MSRHNMRTRKRHTAEKNEAKNQAQAARARVSSIIANHRKKPTPATKAKNPNAGKLDKAPLHHNDDIGELRAQYPSQSGKAPTEVIVDDLHIQAVRDVQILSAEEFETIKVDAKKRKRGLRKSIEGEGWELITEHADPAEFGNWVRRP